jgi:hypothetical protein
MLILLAYPTLRLQPSPLPLSNGLLFISLLFPRKPKHIVLIGSTKMVLGNQYWFSSRHYSSCIYTVRPLVLPNTPTMGVDSQNPLHQHSNIYIIHCLALSLISVLGAIIQP